MLAPKAGAEAPATPTNDAELGPIEMDQDPFAAQGWHRESSTPKIRTLSISEKALTHMNTAGGGYVILCVTSFLMTVHSGRVLGSQAHKKEKINTRSQSLWLRS